MARKASAETVQADMAPPNYRAAVQRLRTIQAKKDKIGSVNGEIADIYAKVEGHKVNRRGAKIFYSLDRMEPDERADVIASLNGLMDAAGWDDAREDLVDQATGHVQALRVGGGGPAGGEGGADGEGGDAGGNPNAEDDGFEASPEELAKQEGRKNSAREKLDPPAKGAGKVTPLRKASVSSIGTPGTAFTGDNSDLTRPQGNA